MTKPTKTERLGAAGLGAMGGFKAGAIAGGVVGGPVGAAIGGKVGALAGAARGLADPKGTVEGAKKMHVLKTWFGN